MTKSKMSKKKKAIIIVSSTVAGFLILVLIGLMIGGSFAWGPFGKLVNIKTKKLAGNADKYAVENVQPLENSPLQGKNICYLGSSITYGAFSLQESYVEFIAKRNGTTFVKEAVSATTLVTTGLGGRSYISRMKKLDKSAKFDLFICQLSTNDATQKKPLGSVSASGTDYDTKTICGAIEYITTYVADTWHCPVIFYTNPYFESPEYAAMVSALYEIQQKHGIGIIDMYQDEDFNNITEEQRELYMADVIHPTRAGYLEWWTPKMEQYIYDFISE